MLIGTDDDPRWAASTNPCLSPDRLAGTGCCAEGHYTPEAAAQHGAELVAAFLAREIRGLSPETAGAKAIRKLEAVA
jgi:hypothetical protein